MTFSLDPEETETRVLHDLVDFTGIDALDIGCGDGRMTWGFARQTRSVLGIDPVAESIRLARDATPPALREHVRFQVADITTVELPPGAFDVALLSWSLC